MCGLRNNYYYCLIGVYDMDEFLDTCTKLNIEIIYTTNDDAVIWTSFELSNFLKKYRHIEKIKNPKYIYNRFDETSLN